MEEDKDSVYNIRKDFTEAEIKAALTRGKVNVVLVIMLTTVVFSGTAAYQSLETKTDVAIIAKDIKVLVDRNHLIAESDDEVKNDTGTPRRPKKKVKVENIVVNQFD